MKFEFVPGNGLVVRLPFRFGVSFWAPYWALVVGIERCDIGIEWHLGPFTGEVWREVRSEGPFSGEHYRPATTGYHVFVVSVIGAAVWWITDNPNTLKFTVFFGVTGYWLFRAGQVIWLEARKAK